MTNKKGELRYSIKRKHMKFIQKNRRKRLNPPFENADLLLENPSWFSPLFYAPRKD